jgi:hypothetical protein
MPKQADIRGCYRTVREDEQETPCALSWGHCGQCRTQRYVDEQARLKREAYAAKVGRPIRAYKWS